MNTKTAKRPRPEKRKLRTVHISFSCDEDMARAILRVARDTTRTRSGTVRSIVRQHLIHSPASMCFSAFPPEQSLELWVWANQQARDAGTQRPAPCETLVVSNDGKRVLRLDLLTAA